MKHGCVSSPFLFMIDCQYKCNINIKCCTYIDNLSFENNMTVSEVLEDIISKMFDSVELNEEALVAYEQKYSKKSKKKQKV